MAVRQFCFTAILVSTSNLGGVILFTMEPAELAAEWFANTQHETSSDDSPRLWCQLDESWYEEPEATWFAILAVLRLEYTEFQEALLAAGPIESLLYLHGEQYIERIEVEAATNSRFNHLLGGVWQVLISDEIWSRLEAVRLEVW